MFEKFRHRSHELENIDKGTYTPAEYEGCILELQRVNKWLGDAKALQNSLLEEINGFELTTFSVLDVAAGSGELLRVAAKWTRETKRVGRFTGLEINERSAKAILEESAEFPEITSVQGNAFALPFADRTFDFVMQSLTLHHFDDRKAVVVLREMMRVAARGIFVIDLHRSPVAYYFYTTVGRLFLHNRLLREDGALSILKSFKPDELKRVAVEANLPHLKIEKHFPSRLVLSAKTDSEPKRG